MKLIEAYKTTDGKIFENWSDADSHQKLLDFITIYENREDKLSGRYEGSTIDGATVASWLLGNKDLVFGLLLNQKGK